MKLFFIICSVLLGWPLRNPAPDAFPQAAISNGIIRAELYLPDSSSGYYQATRFDWSGVIKSLDFKGHSYFGQWFKKYDPKLHDAITGPVEEFQPVGYDSAVTGGSFLKIGVGTLLRPDNKPYSSFTLYQVSNPGKWQVKSGKDQVAFTHLLSDKSGFAYDYSKIVKLVKGSPELSIEHTLKNTGRRAIETTVYDHNFFLIDNEPTGPSVKIRFPFDLSGTGKGIGTVAEIKNAREINYMRALNENENVYIGELTGFTTKVSDYDFRIENTRSGAGVRILCDRPLERLVFWSCSTVSCPEPYIRIKVDPGKEFKWKIQYEFYELKKGIQ